MSLSGTVENTAFGFRSTDESQFSIFYNAYNLHTYDSLNSTGTDIPDILDGLGPGAADLLKFIFLGIGISAATILGIIGNTLSIVVLSSSRMRSSISCFLIGLAVFDTILLINGLFAFGIPTILSYFKAEHILGDVSPFLRFGHLVPIIFGLSVTSITASVYFTLAVTLERYFVVCRPFFARQICTFEKACKFSLGIVTVATVYNIPRWFEYTCLTAYSNDDNDDPVVIGCRPVPTDLRKYHPYDVYYVNLLYLIVHYLFPMCCLIVLNVLIYLKIRKANKNRKMLSVSESKENSLAYMLFIVVAVFLVCNSVPPIHTVWKFITGNKPIPEVETVRTFLLVFNSSVNFVIYCAYGEKFREVFLNIICPGTKIMARLRQGSELSDCSFKCEPVVIHNSFKAKRNASIITICD